MLSRISLFARSIFGRLNRTYRKALSPRTCHIAGGDGQSTLKQFLYHWLRIRLSGFHQTTHSATVPVLLALARLLWPFRMSHGRKINARERWPESWSMSAWFKNISPYISWGKHIDPLRDSVFEVDNRRTSSRAVNTRKSLRTRSVLPTHFPLQMSAVRQILTHNHEKLDMTTWGVTMRLIYRITIFRK
jgi:hypothetical protein